MADWALSPGGVYTDCGATATSTGTQIAGGASANVKGSYVTLFASTPRNVRGFFLGLQGTFSSSNWNTMFDIAIGAAGSEQIIMANVPVGSFNQFRFTHTFIPLELPAGVRVAVRMQTSDVGAQTGAVSMSLVCGGPNMNTGCSIADTYGATTASTNGITLDPGATVNTKGAWAQIVAATSRQHKFIVPCFFTTDGTGYNTQFNGLADLGIGAAGSEQVLIGNLPVAYTANVFEPGGIMGIFPIDIPAGSRLAMRAQASTNVATVRAFQGMILGLG